MTSWTAWPAPPPGPDGTYDLTSPIQVGAKHGNLEWCPPRRTFLYFGGDAGGVTGGLPADGNNNFRNEVWSFDATTGTWGLDLPYCTTSGGARPCRPDWEGIAWDSKRQRFWLWPGAQGVAPNTPANQILWPG